MCSFSSRQLLHAHSRGPAPTTAPTTMGLRMPFARCTLCMLAAVGVARGADNGVGTTPPMGWRSWNAFAMAVNQKAMVQMMHAMTDR